MLLMNFWSALRRASISVISDERLYMDWSEWNKKATWKQDHYRTHNHAFHMCTILTFHTTYCTTDDWLVNNTAAIKNVWKALLTNYSCSCRAENTVLTSTSLLGRIHKLGHKSKGAMTQMLKDTNAGPEIRTHIVMTQPQQVELGLLDHTSVYGKPPKYTNVDAVLYCYRLRCIPLSTP